jgi:hypothetical protein
MKEQQMTTEEIGQIYVDGLLVEIDPDHIRTDDLMSSPRLLDGFSPCPGCKTVLVLRDYCSSCQRIHKELESRTPVFPRIGQTDMGVVPFESEDPESGAPVWAVALILFGALCSVMFLLTGLWFGFRGALDFGIKHGL